VNHIIAPIDSISDNFLDALSLDPRLTVRIVDIAVRTEEGEVHASLVHSDPHLLYRLANKAWNVSSAKDISSNTILHDHLDGTPYFVINCVVVASPVSAPLL